MLDPTQLSAVDTSPAQIVRALSQAGPVMRGLPPSTVRPIYVAHQKDVEAAVHVIRKQRMIGVDIETAAAHAEPGAPSQASGVIRLLQVGIYADDGQLDQQFLFDLYEIDASAVFKVLEDATILKVIQYSHFEHAWLFYHYGVVIRNVLDTYRAWNFQIKPELERLVSEYEMTNSNIAQIAAELLGITMQKDVQTSHWGMLLLDPEQLRYAADDVAVLGPIALATIRLAKSLRLYAAVMRDSNEVGAKVIARLRARSEDPGDQYQRAFRVLERCDDPRERARAVRALRQAPLWHENRQQLLTYARELSCRLQLAA